MLPWSKAVRRGTIELELPVSYQNLLDGVIEFTLTGEQGGVVTVVPEEYQPNNDLIVSASHGSIEITNVHPGTTLYNKLELTVNWGSEEDTLLAIEVKPGPRVAGIPGLVTWPETNFVNHSELTAAIQLILSESISSSKVVLTDKNGVESEYNPINGTITIPAADVQNAIDRKLTLTLYVNNEQKGYVISLPNEESEEYTVEGKYLNKTNGEAVDAPSAYGSMATDFVDIEYVDDIVVGGVRSSHWEDGCLLCAYDDEQRFVRMLFEGHQNRGDSAHVVPDGSYRYVRACGLTAYPYSLSIHYRRRG